MDTTQLALLFDLILRMESNFVGELNKTGRVECLLYLMIMARIEYENVIIIINSVLKKNHVLFKIIFHFNVRL